MRIQAKKVRKAYKVTFECPKCSQEHTTEVLSFGNGTCDSYCRHCHHEVTIDFSAYK